MVEELIREGVAPEDIELLLVSQFGMSPGDAFLMVQTAQGKPGDVLEVVEDAEYDDDLDDDEGLTAAVFDPAKHPRYEAGRREGGRFSPKDGTSSAAAQAEAEQAANEAQHVDAQVADPLAALDDIDPDLEARFVDVEDDMYKLGRLSDDELAQYAVWSEQVAYAGDAEEEATWLGYRDAARRAIEGRNADRAFAAQGSVPGEVVGVRRMGVQSTNPVYVGELDGELVVVKPENQLSPTQLRTWVEPGFDLEREQAAAHVATLIDDPDVAVPVPAYRVKDVQGYGRSGVSDYVEGRTMAQAYQQKSHGSYDGPPLGQWGNDLDNVRLYDGIIGNTDRHEGNLMIDPAGRIHAIDHGLAFPSENQEGWPNVQGGASILPLTEAQRGTLERLRPRIVADTVLPTLLTDSQRAMMQRRIDFMLRENRLPTNDDWRNGWEPSA